jgi:hypothetical protein
VLGVFASIGGGGGTRISRFGGLLGGCFGRLLGGRVITASFVAVESGPTEVFARLGAVLLGTEQRGGIFPFGACFGLGESSRAASSSTVDARPGTVTGVSAVGGDAAAGEIEIPQQCTLGRSSIGVGSGSFGSASHRTAALATEWKHKTGVLLAFAGLGPAIASVFVSLVLVGAEAVFGFLSNATIRRSRCICDFSRSGCRRDFGRR